MGKQNLIFGLLVNLISAVCRFMAIMPVVIHILVHNLFPCFPGPTSLSGSLNLQSNTFFTLSSSSFLKTCPYHHNLSLCTTVTMSSIPNCCLNSKQDSLFLNFTPHIQLIILISVRCNASSFSLFNHCASLPCNIQLCTLAHGTVS